MKRKYKPRLIILITFSSLFFIAGSCDKNKDDNMVDNNDIYKLPADTGGVQLPISLNSEVEYGHYVYMPSGYEKNTSIDYPVLFFLHGSGEKGNSKDTPDILKLVLKNGPPMLINKGKWEPPFPMIVISPQCHEEWWDSKKLRAFMKQMIVKYRINTDRIYLSGLSMGGFGTFDYLQTYGDTGYVAAAVPICGGANLNKANRLVNIPLWVFHGEADGTVNAINSISIVQAIKDLNPTLPPLLTIYPGVGHDSWSRTYDNSGMGKESSKYDPFNMTIYKWLGQYTKKTMPTKTK